MDRRLDADKAAEITELRRHIARQSRQDRPTWQACQTSIVKNMLLHSREEARASTGPIDINAVVEESLNLAYHGARAEKQGFNITLKRLFDPNAGQVDVYPQEITRGFSPT